jgi:hypothetical protein
MGAHSTLLGVRQHICLLKQVRELLPCGAAYRLGISCVVASVARPISSVLKQQSESFTIGVCFGDVDYKSIQGELADPIVSRGLSDALEVGRGE